MMNNNAREKSMGRNGVDSERCVWVLGCMVSAYAWLVVGSFFHGVMGELNCVISSDYPASDRGFWGEFMKIIFPLCVKE